MKNKIKNLIIKNKKLLLKLAVVFGILVILISGFIMYSIFSPVKINTRNFNTIELKKIQKNQDIKKIFSFAVMGDNRDGNKVLEKIISKTNQDTQIKFLFNNGDLVPDGYINEFNKYLKIIQTSRKPFLSIIGNHEWPWYDGENNYEKFFGRRYFSFHYGNSEFIILDDSNEKNLGNEQEKWLIQKLKKSQSFIHRFVFMHVPLYDPRKGNYKKGHSLSNLKIAKKLNDIFDKYKVDMIFASHIHSYFKGEWQKTPYVITGGAGAPLIKDGFNHFIKVSINGNKINYEIEKIPIESSNIFGNMFQEIKNTLNL